MVRVGLAAVHDMHQCDGEARSGFAVAWAVYLAVLVPEPLPTGSTSGGKKEDPTGSARMACIIADSSEARRQTIILVQREVGLGDEVGVPGWGGVAAARSADVERVDRSPRGDAGRTAASRVA